MVPGQLALLAIVDGTWGPRAGKQQEPPETGQERRPGRQDERGWSPTCCTLPGYAESQQP